MREFALMTNYIALINEDEFGKWVIDHKTDGTSEHPIQMPFVNYSEIVKLFVKNVYDFEKKHPEMTLTCYGEILNEHNIQWSSDSMSSADISNLDGQCVMALIMGAVRAERFCDGVLLGFFRDGSIKKWLERLKEIDDMHV